MFVRYIRGPSPLYIEERHRALGRDATFSWSRALTHPQRCNRTRHRGRHLVSDFVGSPSWIGSHGGRHLGPEVMGAAILDLKSWGPPSWIWRRDVIGAKVAPILLLCMKRLHFVAGTGVRKISYVAGGISSIKIHHSVKRINIVYIFSIKYRYNIAIFYWKKQQQQLNFI